MRFEAEFTQLKKSDLQIRYCDSGHIQRVIITFSEDFYHKHMKKNIIPDLSTDISLYTGSKVFNTLAVFCDHIGFTAEMSVDCDITKLENFSLSISGLLYNLVCNIRNSVWDFRLEESRVLSYTNEEMQGCRFERETLTRVYISQWILVEIENDVFCPTSYDL